jgi:hypothetical protein
MDETSHQYKSWVFFTKVMTIFCLSLSLIYWLFIFYETGNRVLATSLLLGLLIFLVPIIVLASISTYYREWRNHQQATSPYAYRVPAKAHPFILQLWQSLIAIENRKQQEFLISVIIPLTNIIPLLLLSVAIEYCLLQILYLVIE